MHVDYSAFLDFLGLRVLLVVEITKAFKSAFDRFATLPLDEVGAGYARPFFNIAQGPNSLA